MKKKKETNLQSCGLANLQTTKTLTRHFVTPSPKGRGERTAFTLAEVLITLGIIGIVAAMTIPTLISNYEKKSLSTQIKTTYSTLSRGMQLLMLEHNCYDNIECTGIFKGETSTETLEEDWNKTFFTNMEKVFKIAKKCDNTNNGCKILGKVKYLSDNETIDFDTMNYTGFVLQDGTKVLFNNSKTEFPTENNSQLKKIVSRIVIDVNGDKGPNQAGRDVFQLVLGQNGVLYADTSIEVEKAKHGENWATSNDYWKNAPQQCGNLDGTIPTTTYVVGTNCLARIIEEGWQIKY